MHCFDARVCVCTRTSGHARAHRDCHAADATVALLSVHAGYRSWRYPREAVLSRSRILFSDLHGPRTQLLCRECGTDDPTPVASVEVELPKQKGTDAGAGNEMASTHDTEHREEGSSDQRDAPKMQNDTEHVCWGVQKLSV